MMYLPDCKISGIVYLNLSNSFWRGGGSHLTVLSNCAWRDWGMRAYVVPGIELRLVPARQAS